MTDFSWGGYFQAIALMCLLLGLLWLGLWTLRRFGKLRMLPNPSGLPKNALLMEMQLPLGPRKGLVVVQFLHKRLLLGVTEQRITLLQELDLPANTEQKCHQGAQQNNDTQANQPRANQPRANQPRANQPRANRPQADLSGAQTKFEPVQSSATPNSAMAKTSSNPEALDFAKVLQNAQ